MTIRDELRALGPWRIAVLVALAALGVGLYFFMTRPASAEGVGTPSSIAGPVTGVGTNWSGFYIGGHAGKGWGKWDGPISYDDHNHAWPQPQYTFDASGGSMDGQEWLGGLQVGANYQTGAWVFGIEADVSWTDMTGSGSFTPYPNNEDSPAWAINTKLDMMGTVRGRLGYATGPMLLYATGGMAWGTTESSIVPDYGTYAGGHGTSDQTHIGWAAGGGVEWALGSNWTMRAEYLFIDLGEKDYAYTGKTISGGAYDTDHYHADLQIHTARMGINYRFGN